MNRDDAAAGTADDAPAPRRGRPRSNRAQEAIKEAATRLFTEKGITGTSVREIAAAAGVDAALVIRHFGSKEALFLQIMAVVDGLPEFADGPLDTLGRTILRRLFEDPERPILPVFRALLGALDRPDIRAHVETALDTRMVEPIRARLAGADRELRARLVAAQISGLILTLAVAPGTTLNATPTEDLLDAYAPALQVLIDAGGDGTPPAE